MRRIAVVATTALTVAIGAAGCGGGSAGSSAASSSASTAATQAPPTTTSSSSGAPAATVADAADPAGKLKFTKSSLTAPAGTVRIKFTNHAAVPHNFTVEPASGGAVVGASPTFSGGTRTLTLKLKPGTYTFFCSVPGHRQAGMQGTLIVK